MSKRGWTLLAVAVVLALLVGGYFLLSRPKAVPASAAKPVELSKGDKDKLVKVVLTDRPEGTLTLSRTGSNWSLEPRGPASVTLDPSNVDDLAALFTSLSADRVIDEKPADLSQFGLKPPRATGIGTFSDGSAHTLYLGDKSPTGSSYYAQVKGDPRVFTIFSYNGEHFHWTVADLRSKTITPAINYDEVTYVKLVQADGTVIEAKEKTPDEVKSYQLGFGKYILTRPFAYPRGLDGEKQDSLIKGAQGIAIASFAEDEPRSLEKYGLARPLGEVLVRDKTNTVDFLVGGRKDATESYFMVKGQPTVYTTATSNLSFMSPKPFDLVDKFIFIPNIEDVDRMEITTAGKTHVLAIARTTKKAEKKGDEDTVESTYTVDGKSADDGNFKKFYQAVIGLLVEGETTHRVPNVPDVTVRYTLNKGKEKTVTLEYAPYDRDFDAIFMNGVNVFALTKQQISGMLVKLDLLVKGEKVPD
jgi:hypothetical protein